MNKDITQILNQISMLLEGIKNPNWIDYVNIFCTLFLAIAAFSTVIVSIRNFKKSQKSEKIEEIFTLIENIAHFYSLFLPVYNDLKSYNKEKDSDVVNTRYEQYQKSSNELLKKIDKKILLQNLLRIEILSRAYLSSNLNIKVLSLNRMFRDLLDATLNMNWIVAEMFWKEGFPQIDKFNNYIDDIGNSIVEEIGSSKSKKNFRKKLREYTEKKFKKDLGLK